MSITNYTGAVDYLNTLFDLVNQVFFESALSKPTITIQSTPRAYGHFTPRDDAWISTVEGETPEINIGAGTLDRPIASVVETLLHEMVHYFNYLNGIQDCSRNNSYHNKRFKVAAEEHGLVVSYSKGYGWAHTEPGPKLLAFLHTRPLAEIQIYRNERRPDKTTDSDHQETVVNHSSTRKYCCPGCGMSVRATKNVNVACIDCGKQLVLVPRRS